MINNYLDSCPFCGDSAVLHTRYYLTTVEYYVSCSRCFCMTNTYRRMQDAIDRWNTRVHNDIDRKVT